MDDLSKHLRALENLEEPVNQWDTLIVHLISSKLDPVTKREWESKVISDNWSTVDELTEYLSDRCQLFETVQTNNRSLSHLTSETKSYNCPVCNEEHKLYKCKIFLNLSRPSKYSEVKRHNRCVNCLGTGHSMKLCRARGCEKCNGKHNSLLHRDDMSKKLDSEGQEDTVNIW